MNNITKLFHLSLAHHYWEHLLEKGDCVIDATCGNGHDSLTLAKLIISHEKAGHLYGYDIQKQAIENTLTLLKEHLSMDDQSHITLLQKSHKTFSEIPQNASIKLIVYNLGYLPGADKTITTTASSTLESIENGLKILSPNGGISITCYPGHPEGIEETNQIHLFLKNLSHEKWKVFFHQQFNREGSPCLFWISPKS